MRKRLRSHEGANAVEFALVLPLLLMLIFGAITAGLTLNAKQQMDHATREGARYAATLPFGASACNGGADPWQDCVHDRVMATAVGSVNLSEGGICITHIDDAGITNSYFYGNATTEMGTTNAGDPCVTETPSLSGPRVHVKTTAPGRVDAIFVRTGIFDLVSKSISRYEAG